MAPMADDLDHLLNQPLAEIPDNGFSGRTMALVELQQLRRSRLRTEVYVGLVILAVMVLPFTPLGAALSAAAFTRTGIALIGLAAAAVILVSQRKRPAKTYLTV
jgi:hypothetical protein